MKSKGASRMGWTPQKPNRAGTLREALPAYRTPACRALAAGYLVMLDAAPGRIPHKNELDLANFASVMPHLALVAISKPDRCIYRVAGERLKERVGLNLTGRNYYDFVQPERRQIAAGAMHMVIDTPCAFRAEMRQTYSGGVNLMIEASGFPLLSSESGVDGFILFADQGIDKLDDLLTPHPILQGASLRHRDLIDLGFGVDEAFEDLIEAS
jgi:hypothetical protein